MSGIAPTILLVTAQSRRRVSMGAESPLVKDYAKKNCHNSDFSPGGNRRKNVLSNDMAETKAFVDRIGLWSDAHPIPPWRWRNERRTR